MSADTQRNPSFDEIVKLNEQLDRQLDELNGKQKRADHSRESFSWKKFLGKLLLLAASLGIPFVVLIRTSVYMYGVYHLHGWLALAVGVASTVVLLMGYGIFLAYRYDKGIQLHKYIFRGIVVLVMAYTLYGVLYYSSLNTKTEEIGSYYRSLHPIMRVTLATVTLADSDLLVTDIRRKAEDYARMGLPENQESLHYVQSDGYVHAVDLRTKGRAEWKNWLTRTAFHLAGLESVRHVGTADHLHIYLPLNE